MLGITDDNDKRGNSRKRKRRGVSFNEDEEIINLEDIDPNIGRFRNLIQTTIIPSTQKRPKLSNESPIHSIMQHTSSSELGIGKSLQSTIIPHLYQDIPPESMQPSTSLPQQMAMSSAAPAYNNFSNLSARLGMSLPNPAPEVDMMETQPIPSTAHNVQFSAGGNGVTPMEGMTDSTGSSQEPKKKKYAKEAWPGKKPVAGLF